MDAILTFHSIDDHGSLLSYPPADLETLLDALAEQVVHVVRLADLLRPASDDRHRVALTFDDGLCTFHDTALPILARRGLPATVYVVTGWVGRANRWPSQPAGIPSLALMGWDELRAVRDAGVQIGSHTATHPHLRQLDELAWQEELRGARARLEDELQGAVRDFAYPYGTYDAEAVRRVSEVYATAVTADLAFSTGTTPHLLPRIDTYYLRSLHRGARLFGARTRAYLALRAALRRFRRRA